MVEVLVPSLSSHQPARTLFFNYWGVALCE